MEWNILAAATCRDSRKGLPSDDLELNKNAQYREYVLKVDPCLGMVVTRWKDSRALQTISTVIVKGTTAVHWNVSADELAALQHGGVIQRKRLIK
eukprot:207122-Ditylum_brightwellii.AAC.1